MLFQDNNVDAEGLAAAHEEWRKPPRNLIEQKPKGGTTLDYLGHAALTEILLRVDPLWYWDFVAFENGGNPTIDRDKDGRPIGMWLRLVILGHSRYGYGSVDPSSRQSDGDRIKELIGDGLRNAAMRFGIALDLWSKSDLSATLQTGGTASNVASSPSHREQTTLVGGASETGSLGGASTPPNEDDMQAMLRALKGMNKEDKDSLLTNIAVLEDGKLEAKPTLKRVAELLIANKIDPNDPITSSADAAFTRIKNDELAADAQKETTDAS